MKKYFLFLIPISVLLTGWIWFEISDLDQTSEPCEISAKDFLSKSKDHSVTIDVRTKDEFDKGHLKGAILIDIYQPDFAEQIRKLDPNQKFYVYCQSGIRSLKAIKLMMEMGFKEVCHVEGGIIQLRKSGVPLEK